MPSAIIFSYMDNKHSAESPRYITGYLLDEDSDWKDGDSPYESCPDLRVYNVDGQRILGVAEFGVVNRVGRRITVQARIAELFAEITDHMNDQDASRFEAFVAEQDPIDFVVLIVT